MKNIKGKLLVILILSLLLAACGSNTAPGDNAGNNGEEGGFNFSNQETGDNQPEEAGMEFGENEVEDPDNDSENDGEEGFEFFEGDDACLEGTWLLDIGTFGEGLASRLNENLPNGSFDVTPVMGELRMIFDGDAVEMRTDLPLVFKVDLTASGMLLSEMEIEVTANGSAHWMAADNHIILYGQEVHADGSGDWESELINGAGSSGAVSLDFSMGELFVSSEVIDLSSLALDVPVEDEHAARFYDCDETDLVVFTDDSIYGDQWFIRE